MSIIIDGMDQSNCELPYLGTQSTFKNKLKQCITGVKEHGKGVTLYRTIDMVNKGSDLTIHCILAQLEKWYLLNECFPEEIYIQGDGGSENANQYVLALCELLVAKRMARVVKFTRLPVGHTHEDIDAAFGVIRNFCFGNHINTFQQYKDEIEDELGKSKLNVEVEDVYATVNYQNILAPIIDEHLANLHKEIYTQHQWRFEACAPTSYFPLGAKTTYRAYCSDAVVEFRKVPKRESMTHMGSILGYEPTMTFCTWYPTRSCDKTRPVEGIYLLRGLPHVTKVTYTPFPVDIIESINKTLVEVRSRWDLFDDKAIRDAWNEWTEKYSPTVTDSNEYVRLQKAKGVHVNNPLSDMMFDSNFVVHAPEWANTMSSGQLLIDPSFQWPEVFAMATNSVITDFNRHPPEPRMYAIVSEDAMIRLGYFKSLTDIYYTKLNTNPYTIKKLVEMMKQKLTYSGDVLSITG
jgi:hypothetical protein